MTYRMRILVVQEHEIEVGELVVFCKTQADMETGKMDTFVTINGQVPSGIKRRSTVRTDQAMKNHAELLGYAIMTAVDAEERKGTGK